MNEQRVRMFYATPDENQGGGQQTTLSAARIRLFLRRQALVLVWPVVLALAAAFVNLRVTTPIYTAQAQIIIDPRLPQFIPGRNVDTVMSWDTAQVESEIAVLKSERIAGLVTTKLKLAQDPTFRIPPSPFDMIMSLLPLHMRGRESSEPDPYRDALSVIDHGLDVRRVGLSYAISVTFGFPDPARAQQVTNAITEAYISDQLRSKAEAARQGGDWLQDRMVKLRLQMNAASRAVQAFRASHNYSIPKSLDAASGPQVAEVGGGQAGAVVLQDATLDELEASYSMYRRVYESFLQSFTEATQRQSFPVSDAYVLNEASLPQAKSSPRGALIYPLAGILGLLAGFGLALGRNQLDRTLVMPAQVQETVGLSCLCTLPNLRRPLFAAPWVKAKALVRWLLRPGGTPSLALLRMDVKPRRQWWERRKPHTFCAVRDPDQVAFRQGMQSFQVCLDLARSWDRLGSIGITASHRGEGSSTVASNLAVLLADMGVKTLLVDADFERRSLTTQLRKLPDKGLADVLAGEADLEEAVLHFRSASLDMLPAVGLRTTTGCRRLTRSCFKDVLRQAGSDYEAIIVDLPPALPIADTLSIGPFLEGVVIVVKAGRSTRDTLATVAGHFANARTRLLGFVMSNTDAVSARP